MRAFPSYFFIENYEIFVNDFESIRQYHKVSDTIEAGGTMKGQKYSEEIKEKARALLSVNDNAEYVARQMDIPVSTVRTWKKQFLAETPGEDSFAEIRKKNKEAFINAAWRDIDLASDILHRRLKRASQDERKLDSVLAMVALDSELEIKDKKAIIDLLLSIKLVDISKISTVLGVLYDKQALASKDATSVVDTNVKYEDL